MKKTVISTPLRLLGTLLLIGGLTGGICLNSTEAEAALRPRRAKKTSHLSLTQFRLREQIAKPLLTEQERERFKILSSDLSYGLVGEEGSLESEDATILRSGFDRENVGDMRYAEVSFENASLLSELPGTTSLGFQEVAWGTSLGMNVVEVVNPYNERDTYNDDFTWTRESTCMVNTQFELGRFTFQGIFTPAPPPDRLPKRLAVKELIMNSDKIGAQKTDYDRTVAQSADYDKNIGEMMEYGTKVGYNFRSGSSADLFYYRHWNRNEVYGGANSADVFEKVHSIGLIGKHKVSSSFTLRSDSIITLGEPQMTDLQDDVPRRDHFKNVIGTDIVENGWTLGLQYHSEIIGGGEVEDARYQKWVSGLVKKSLFNGKFESQLFVFEGLGNSDLWLEPKIVWNPSSTVSVSVRADRILFGDSNLDGVLAQTQEEDKVVGWISCKL